MLQGIPFEHGALGGEAGHAEGGQDVGREQGVLVEGGGVEAHRIDGGHAGFPVVALEVAGHRADGVSGAVEQIDLAVTVEVHRIPCPAGGHELRHTHCAGVAATCVERIGAGAVVQVQELLQLALEVGAALGCTRVAGGEVEGQGGQCIHHPEAAHLLAVDRLHPDDAHDDLGGHAVFLLGPLQCGAVVLPEAHAGADTHRVDEAAAVHAPVLRCAHRRWCHQPADGGQLAGLAHHVAHPGRVHVAAGGHVIGKGHGGRAVGVPRGGLRLAGGAAGLVARGRFFRRILCICGGNTCAYSYQNGSKSEKRGSAVSHHRGLAAGQASWWNSRRRACSARVAWVEEDVPCAVLSPPGA